MPIGSLIVFERLLNEKYECWYRRDQRNQIAGLEAGNLDKCREGTRQYRDRYQDVVKNEIEAGINISAGISLFSSFSISEYSVIWVTFHVWCVTESQAFPPLFFLLTCHHANGLHEPNCEEST